MQRVTQQTLFLTLWNLHYFYPIVVFLILIFFISASYMLKPSVTNGDVTY